MGSGDCRIDGVLGAYNGLSFSHSFVDFGVIAHLHDFGCFELIEMAAGGSGWGVSSRDGNRWESLEAIGTHKQRVFV